jgi:hypothetical protein
MFWMIAHGSYRTCMVRRIQQHYFSCTQKPKSHEHFEGRSYESNTDTLSIASAFFSFLSVSFFLSSFFLFFFIFFFLTRDDHHTPEDQTVIPPTALVSSYMILIVNHHRGLFQPKGVRLNY